MPSLKPINFTKWVEENGDRLKPPVNNYCLYDGGDVTVMVVGGPNARNVASRGVYRDIPADPICWHDSTDYHINETEEWFYQVKGPMTLKIVEGTTRSTDRHPTPEGLQAYQVQGGRCVILRSGRGRCFCYQVDSGEDGVSQHTAQPVSICRHGRDRARAGSARGHNRLRWYCDNPAHETLTLIREVTFHCTDLGTQLKPIIEEWMTTPSLRNCGECGKEAPAK
ncbi:BQ5605_C042g12015 [Microbotryum silenes-dioicae]|uniref:BQ5605_C042g12015 protein n=1 Tax=Microbotryum silenes-dioicae TaxID=796604 RepID=A0A2X0NBX0_9BASI|nr:BQ5605_C042g12015 [Microbotryum silenes-dioicae]